MIDLTEIRSLTEFVRHSKEYVGKIKRKISPMALTVNGKAELLIQDAESYQAIRAAYRNMWTKSLTLQKI
jgi:hypothetical protein